MTGPGHDSDRMLEDGRGYAAAAAGAAAVIAAAAGAIVICLTGQSWYLLLVVGCAGYAGAVVAWSGWCDVIAARRHRATMARYRDSITEGFAKLLGDDSE